MGSGIQTTTSLAATDMVQVIGSGAVKKQIIASQGFGQFQTSFTTSAQTNSTSVTLSTVFTALTYTQTSTGNTVHLKAAPVANEIQGFSVTNIVTNLTVSSAANTVSGGAIGTTVVGNTFWWIFDSVASTWYRFNGR